MDALLRQLQAEQQSQRKMLHALNSAASVLLSAANPQMFRDALLAGMEIIGKRVLVDRIYIWRNARIDGQEYYVHQYGWLSSFGRQTRHVHPHARFPYSNSPEWQEKFLLGECVNGALHSLSQAEQDMLAPYDIRSLLVVPVHLQDHFEGFVSFEDCRQERAFTAEETGVLRSVSLMLISAVNRNEQTLAIKEAHTLSERILNVMPLGCVLWSGNVYALQCNDETLKLFGLRDPREYGERFFDLSPQHQPDGQLSSKKVSEYTLKALKDGRCVFEWLHRTLDGTLVPSEVTLVRVEADGKYILVGYIRDLREAKPRLREIEQRDKLLDTLNRVISLLLQSEIHGFDMSVQLSLDMLAGAVDMARASLWRNYSLDGKHYCNAIYIWSDGVEERQNDARLGTLSYSEELTALEEETLLSGRCVSVQAGGMSPERRAMLSARGIVSLFIVPVFLRDQFLGVVVYGNRRHERRVSANEELFLCSGSRMLFKALLRHEMTQGLHASAAKLRAVVANYSGIIWSVDQDEMITLYDGLTLARLGKKPSQIEGQKIGDYLHEDQHAAALAHIRKTFTEGSQDWVSEIDGKAYQAHSAPLLDGNGRTIGVVGSFDDVTTLNWLEAELKTALRNAQEANEAKSNFLAHMSHEMRTPLNAIIGLSELLLGSKSLAGKQYAHLEKIYNAGATLLGLVNDLLDISKIEAGKFELVLVDYDTPSLINDAITQSILHIGEKPVRFSLNLDEHLPVRLYGDELRVKQILNNLLSNAFKYTNAGMVELDVSCVREGEALWLTARVRDTGIGIRPEDMDTLFADYVKLDAEANRHVMGAGLGLPIAKRLVAMMGGSIAVESEYGQGSVFTVTLRQKFVTDTVIGREMVKNLQKLRYSDRSRRHASRQNRLRLPYARVLVVDDMPTNLAVAKGMLKLYGMRIDCVTSGQKAIDAIRAEKVRYNAVFMDHMMPEMDGIEAVRRIREEIGTEYARAVPIIALTANAIVGNEEMFLRSGFQAFLSKPIGMRGLDAVIRAWVRDRKLEEPLPRRRIHDKGALAPEMRGGGDRRRGIARQTLDTTAIAGLDMRKAVRRVGGDEAACLQVLRSFATNARPLLETIREAPADSLAEYIIAVHGIKGACQGICAGVAAARAEALEKAAREGNASFVRAHNPAFLELAWRLVTDIEKMLGKMAAEIRKPNRRRPDQAALARLLAACEDYDLDEVDAAMSELEGYEYAFGGKFVAWLRTSVDRMDFSGIQAKLLALAKKSGMKQ